MGKMSKDVASLEVDKWLDFKQVEDEKRKTNKDSIEAIVNSIAAGILSLNQDTFEFTQKLKFPIKSQDGTQVIASVFKYKARLSMREIKANVKNIDSGSTFDMLTAYTSALTGEGTGVLDGMDTEDNKVAQSIAIFFL